MKTLERVARYLYRWQLSCWPSPAVSLRRLFRRRLYAGAIASVALFNKSARTKACLAWINTDRFVIPSSARHVIAPIVVMFIVTMLAVSCNPASADDDYRSLIVTTLIATGGDTPSPTPGPAPQPTPGPVPLKDCVVCRGTGFITHGDGHKTPCPEDHAASELAAHYKRIATAMGGVAVARPTIMVKSLTPEEYEKKYGYPPNSVHPPMSMASGCDCESGGPCTCGDDCDCKDCQCSDCPGKTSKTVELTVCDASGCRKVRTKATRKEGFWYAQHGPQWHIWKAGKWQKIAPAGDGSYRIERPTIKPLWKAQPLTRAPGQHSHRCGMPGCGHVWSHYPGQSHNCPECGRFTNSNTIQINPNRSRYVEWNTRPRPVMRQPRRMFASRGG